MFSFIKERNFTIVRTYPVKGAKVGNFPEKKEKHTVFDCLIWYFTAVPWNYPSVEKPVHFFARPPSFLSAHSRFQIFLPTSPLFLPFLPGSHLSHAIPFRQRREKRAEEPWQEAVSDPLPLLFSTYHEAESIPLAPSPESGQTLWERWQVWKPTVFS